jgi:hypothetical protein
MLDAAVRTVKAVVERQCRCPRSIPTASQVGTLKFPWMGAMAHAWHTDESARPVTS